MKIQKKHLLTGLVYARQVGKFSLWGLGGMFLLILLFAFTDQPFYAYHWLGTSVENDYEGPTEHLVYMSAGGLPDKTSLMRLWFLEESAEKYPESEIWLAIPGDTLDSLNSIFEFQHLLISRGIDSSRIHLMPHGFNTASQALESAKNIPVKERVEIISSPEHMRRCLLSFRKAGFEQLKGLPGFEENLANEDLEKSDSEEIDQQIQTTKNLTLRYQFWTQLEYELIVAREFFALGYYRIKGYI